jgi:hypothetical protein
MRVILDTNILLSALTVVTGDDLIMEVLEGATRPFFKARLRAGVVEFLAANLQALSVPLLRTKKTVSYWHRPRLQTPVSWSQATRLCSPFPATREQG